MLAEYTDAPASLTITYFTSVPFTVSAANLSVSRPAVPLPMDMTFTLCFFMSPVTMRSASAILLWGGAGYMTAVSSTLPVSSTTATLQPVR